MDESHLMNSGSKVTSTNILGPLKKSHLNSLFKLLLKNTDCLMYACMWLVSAAEKTMFDFTCQRLRIMPPTPLREKKKKLI